MKIKRTLLLTLAIVFSLGLLAGCGESEAPKNTATPSPAPTDNVTATPDATATPEDEGEPDEERTALVVGFDAEFPPYGYQDASGEYVGFDLDLAAEVCARRGWELVKHPIVWDAKDMELDSGTIDCIWNGFTKSEVRLNQYEWTDAYVDNSQVFVVRADSGISTIADLAGKLVAVQAASSAQTAIEKEENADMLASFSGLDLIPDYNTAFMNLEAGAVDAVAMDIGVAQFHIAQREEGAFVILDELLDTEQYAIGFKLGNTELRDQVFETLMTMVDDGTFTEIAEKWELTNAVCLGK